MQMMAECVYAATFSMRDPKGMKVQDMFPMLFEETDEPHAPDITEEEAAALQAEMDAWNWSSGTPESRTLDTDEPPEENPDNSENAAE
jgi:hypothetical protein